MTTRKPGNWGEWQSTRGLEINKDWLARITPGELQIFTPYGRQMTIYRPSNIPAIGFVAYRLWQHEPRVETVRLYGWAGRDPNWKFHSFPEFGSETYKITFNLVDGKADCSSIKMEELDDHQETIGPKTSAANQTTGV